MIAARMAGAVSKSISATHAARTSGPYSDHFTVRRRRSLATSTSSNHSTICAT
jgi:hypothetical protein